MARRSWDELSPDYRARLERNGIGQAGYEAGVSLKGARGHGGSSGIPPDFRDGNTSDDDDGDRETLARDFVMNFDFWFAGYYKYDHNHVVERTQVTDPSNPRYISNDDLRRGANANENELISLASMPSQPGRYNPFYYH